MKMFTYEFNGKVSYACQEKIGSLTLKKKIPALPLICIFLEI